MKTSTTTIRQPKARGFSLAEVLVAMFVILVGISGITSTIWWGTQRADSGQLVTEASNHARTLFETVVSRNLVKLAADSNGGNFPVGGGTFGLVSANAGTRTPVYAAPFDKATLGVDLARHVRGQSTATSMINPAQQLGSQNEVSSEMARFTRNIDCRRGAVANPGVDDYQPELCTLIVAVYWREGRHERNVSVQGVIRHNVSP